MKNCSEPTIFGQPVNLQIDPKDEITWKLLMLLEASCENSDSIENIARKYGFTREHFYTIKSKFEQGGSAALASKPRGPKSNHKRTDQVEKQIIRHRFLDPEANCAVIAQRMNQSGHSISLRSVERTINDYGLQKKGYIKQLKQKRKSG